MNPVGGDSGISNMATNVMTSTTPIRIEPPTRSSAHCRHCTTVVGNLVLSCVLLMYGTGCRESQGVSDASISPQVPPSVDTNLTCPTLALGSDERDFTLFWTAPSGALTYFLEQDRDPNFPSPGEVYRGPLTSARTSLQVGGQQWYFRVRATNRTSISPWSNIVGVMSRTAGSHAPDGAPPP